MPAPERVREISSVDFARSSSSGISGGGGAPRRPAGCSACCRVRIAAMPRPIHAPLSEIARRNSPLVRGEPTSPAEIAAPADSPKIVTLRGSPPKAAMLICTHLSAVIVSISA